jgi:transposase InsO family protein
MVATTTATTRSQTLAERRKETLLLKLFTDPRSTTVYTSAVPLLAEARRHIPSITRRDVHNFLASQPTYTRHRRAVRRFPRLPTLAAGLHTDWQADLADIQLLRRANRGYGYLLVAIDVLSRQIFVEPMRRKFAADAVKAFSEIFRRARVIPWRIYTDQGREFVAAPVQQLFRTHHIIHRMMVTSPQFHAGMVERAIRTIKERLWKHFTDKRNHCWITVIQDIVAAINGSPHSGLDGLTPCSVTFRNAQQVRRKQWTRAGVHTDADLCKKISRFNSSNYLLKVGDRVRIEAQKHTFEKGYLPRFSLDVYRVSRVRRGDPRLAPRLPVTYRLVGEKAGSQEEELPGWFYQQQLCKVSNK